jgi:low temperature requirement protein LtrA
LVIGESIAAVAVSLWWTHFDLAGAAATSTLVERADHRSTLLHDVYAYGH